MNAPLPTKDVCTGLRRWHELKGAQVFLDAADEIERLQSRLTDLEALTESLQNRLAARPLSSADTTALEARVEELERTLADERATRRWNLEVTPTGFRVCLGEHEKAEGCEYINYVPESHFTRRLAETEAVLIKVETHLANDYALNDTNRTQVMLSDVRAALAARQALTGGDAK